MREKLILLLIFLLSTTALLILRGKYKHVTVSEIEDVPDGTMVEVCGVIKHTYVTGGGTCLFWVYGAEGKVRGVNFSGRCPPEGVFYCVRGRVGTYRGEKEVIT